MDIFFKVILALHIGGGSVALGSGALAMTLRKTASTQGLTQQGLTHVRVGRIYFWAMTAVAASAVVMCFLKPQQFLFYVAIFSYYLTFTGYRSIARKRAKIVVARVDWFAAVIGLAGGATMLVRGGMQTIGGESFGFVSVVFGGLCVGFSVLDMVRFSRPPAEKMAWWFNHLQRMLGAYIATFTAFLVVNATMLPQLVVWLAPTIVGTLGISAWTVYYKRKFRPSNIA